MGQGFHAAERPQTATPEILRAVYPGQAEGARMTNQQQPPRSFAQFTPSEAEGLRMTRHEQPQRSFGGDQTRCNRFLARSDMPEALRDANGAKSTRYAWMREACAMTNRATGYISAHYAMDAKGTPLPIAATRAAGATARASRGLRDDQIGKPFTVSWLRDGAMGTPSPSRRTTL